MSFGGEFSTKWRETTKQGQDSHLGVVLTRTRIPAPVEVNLAVCSVRVTNSSHLVVYLGARRHQQQLHQSQLVVCLDRHLAHNLSKLQVDFLAARPQRNHNSSNSSSSQAVDYLGIPSSRIPNHRVVYSAQPLNRLRAVVCSVVLAITTATHSLAAYLASQHQVLILVACLAAQIRIRNNQPRRVAYLDKSQQTLCLEAHSSNHSNSNKVDCSAVVLLLLVACLANLNNNHSNKVFLDSHSNNNNHSSHNKVHFLRV